MSGALDFETLAQLAGIKPIADVPCLRCGPDRSTRATQQKPTLRIWRVAPDFFTYFCARCGEKGSASDGNAKPIDRAELKRRLRAAKEHHQAALTRRKSIARRLWRQSQPISGTIGETYLCSRSITVMPPTLRFLPAWGEYPAAMVAPFGLGAEPDPGAYDIGPAAVSAIHLTKLAPDGAKLGKIMLGVTEDWPLALVPPNDLGGLAIAEGIEDALSIHQATGLGAWAAGAAVRLPKLAPLIAGLAYVEAVTIAVDDDDAGRRGAEVLASELRRLRRQSIEVNTFELREAVNEAA